MHRRAKKRSHAHVKDPVVDVRVWMTMEQQNNPARTKGVSLHQVEVVHYMVEEEEKAHVSLDCPL